MRSLILSDIHGNLQALEAVLADAAGQYERILCCGDLVGYGANPAEVVGWARGSGALTVRGNHDRAVALEESPEDWSDNAVRVIAWTRTQLSARDMAWLAALPAGPEAVAGCEMFHGSPDDEDGYLLTDEDVRNVRRQAREALTLIGHTHCQRVWRVWHGSVWDVEGRTVGLEPGRRYLVNPGSVGQPRDRDPRAAYAIWDSAAETVELRRVEYDIATAAGRIRAAGLPEFLAERLESGR